MPPISLCLTLPFPRDFRRMWNSFHPSCLMIQSNPRPFSTSTEKRLLSTGESELTDHSQSPAGELQLQWQQIRQQAISQRKLWNTFGQPGFPLEAPVTIGRMFRPISRQSYDLNAAFTLSVTSHEPNQSILLSIQSCIADLLGHVSTCVLTFIPGIDADPWM